MSLVLHYPAVVTNHSPKVNADDINHGQPEQPPQIHFFVAREPVAEQDAEDRRHHAAGYENAEDVAAEAIAALEEALRRRFGTA